MASQSSTSQSSASQSSASQSGAPEPGFTVILIGESQNGKTSLMRLLLECNDYALGNGIESCSPKVFKATKKLSVAIQKPPSEIGGVEVADRNFTVIDTPGLNDTRNQMNQVLCSIYDCLARSAEMSQPLSKIILVIKYGRSLDDSYRALLSFYLDIFGREHMRSNLIVIYTHIKYSDQWKEEELFTRQTSWESIIKKTHAEVEECFGCSVPDLAINSRPMPNDQEECNQTFSLVAWLRSICATSPGFVLSAADFPKPPSIVEADRLELAACQGKLEGIQATLTMILDDKNIIDSQLRDTVFQNGELRTHVQTLRSELLKWDNDSSVLLHSERHKKESFLEMVLGGGGWHSINVDWTASVPITGVSAVMGNTESIKLVGMTAKGKLYGFFLQNLDCILSFYTTSRLRYQDRIAGITEQIQSRQQELNALSRQIEEQERQLAGKEKQAARYTAHVSELQLNIINLKHNRISLKDFKARCHLGNE